MVTRAALAPADLATLAASVGRAMLVAAPPLLVALAVVLNAWSGLMPGVGFWDTGEFQTVLPILGTAHPTGYPTYVVIGFIANLLLAPVGPPAFRMNALSLLVVAAAAGCTVLLVRRLTRSTAVAIAAGLGLATTPLVWSNAVRADPHPIHLAFVALLFLLLVRWEQAHRTGMPNTDRWLIAAAVAFGLAAGNHSLMLLLIPPIGLYILAVDRGVFVRPGLVLTCGLAAVGTLVLVYLELPLRAGLLRAPLVYGHPETWDGFWSIALAEQFRGSLVDPFGDVPGKVAALWRLAWDQLGVLAPVLPLAFLVTAVRQWRYAVLSGAAMALTLWFDASYLNADIGRYYLGPVLWAWTWLGLLAASLVDAGVAAVRSVASALGAGSRSRWVGRFARVVVGVLIAVSLLLPTLDDWQSRRFQGDRHLDTSASRWVDNVLAAVEPDAVIVSWWSTSTPLWYAQLVEGRRTDVFVADDRTILDLDLGSAMSVIDQNFGVRPVYVIRAGGRDLGVVLGSYRLEAAAGEGALTVWHVVARRTASP